MPQWVTTEFFYRINHGQNILRWHIVHDGVHGSDHSAATGTEEVDHPAPLLTYLLDAAIG